MKLKKKIILIGTEEVIIFELENADYVIILNLRRYIILEIYL